MLSVTGIFDGNSVLLTEAVHNQKKCKVIVTFLEETESQNEAMLLRDFGMQSKAFDFWNTPAEDVYQDYVNRKDENA